MLSASRNGAVEADHGFLLLKSWWVLYLGEHELEKS